MSKNLYIFKIIRQWCVYICIVCAQNEFEATDIVNQYHSFTDKSEIDSVIQANQNETTGLKYSYEIENTGYEG